MGLVQLVERHEKCKEEENRSSRDDDPERDRGDPFPARETSVGDRENTTRRRQHHSSHDRSAEQKPDRVGGRVQADEHEDEDHPGDANQRAVDAPHGPHQSSIESDSDAPRRSGRLAEGAMSPPDG